jgi:hypothetical protein
MLYAVLIYGVEREYNTESRDKRAQRMASHLEALQKEHDDGVLVTTARLLPTKRATTVRATANGIAVTDGPFAETKEQFGGFQVLNCDTLEQVVAYAKTFVAHGGTVEIRPLHPDPGSVD